MHVKNSTLSHNHIFIGNNVELEPPLWGASLKLPDILISGWLNVIMGVCVATHFQFFVNSRDGNGSFCTLRVQLLVSCHQLNSGMEFELQSKKQEVFTNTNDKTVPE
jgi:hypothetical protein